MNRRVAVLLTALAMMAAALVPMHRVFISFDWLPGAALAALASVVLASVLHRARVPGGIALVVSVAVLTAYATIIHATQFGPWPTPDALGELVDQVTTAARVFQAEPAPLAVFSEVQLVLTIAAWMVGHTVHDAMVRLERPGTGILSAGLLWFVPLAIPVADAAVWPNALPFLFVVGLVLLLVPDPDTAGWLREHQAPAMPATGVVLAAVAAAAGLLAPWLSLGYDQPALVDVRTETAPRGYQPLVDVTNRLKLPTPRDVLQVHSASETYLRIAALDSFDGSVWRLGPTSDSTFRPDPDALHSTEEEELPFEVPIEAFERVELDVEVLALENIYVPVPYQVSTVTSPTDAEMFYSTQGGFVATGALQDEGGEGAPMSSRAAVVPGFQYTAESAIPVPGYADLRAEGDISLPPDDPRVALPGDWEEVETLTRRIADEAGATTSIDVTLAVQDWFTGPDSTFTYSLDPPAPRSETALTDFLFDHQTGYCEYYASGMAVMLRSVGIPARVSVGFLPGEMVTEPTGPGEPATYTVSTEDAHAWVEVLFEGHGWVRMDPTPRSESQPATQQSMVPVPPASGPEEQPATPEPSQPQPQPQPDPEPEPSESGPDGSGGDDASDIPWLPLVISVLLALGVVAFYLRTSLRHRFAGTSDDPTAAVLASQRRVLRTAAELGVGRRPSETTTEAAVRWTKEGLVGQETAVTFARIGSQAAFGIDVTADDATRMRQLEDEVVAGFQDGIDRRQRLTAPWQDVRERLLTR